MCENNIINDIGYVSLNVGDSTKNTSLSDGASHRRQVMRDAQQLAQKKEADQKRALRRTKLRSGIKSFGNALQRMSPAKWIDDLEKDQGLADMLEEINFENEEDFKRREICREAEAACLEAVLDHLKSFLEEKPQSTYEEWIEELHPENAHEGKLSEETGKTIDHRFYVLESDHRMFWNENLNTNGILVRQHVAPRSQKNGAVDLLTGDDHDNKCRNND